ncbi:MAG: pyrroloquinoline quinone biosynthesis protein PqqC [Legionellales bacterium]|nr:pyrroloquinoline quinone biosynthesis protein PqqC [Legionellales bacterium]
MLVDALKIGFSSISNLKEKFTTISDQVLPIITELDRNGLITESEFNITDKSVSGAQLYRELFSSFDVMKIKYANSNFYNLLLDKKITRPQLIGYVMEYYQLVKLTPGLIAPALTKIESKKIRRVLQDFFKSELYHDTLLEESLNSVEVDIDLLDYVQPLQTTFGICASLGVYAQQHPLTFKAALFIFEEPYPEFNDAFKDRCIQLDMPQNFYEPILKHSNINEEGKHDSISQILLEDIGAISYEEKITVKKHFAILVESLLKQEEEVIRFYGAMENFKARLFI